MNINIELPQPPGLPGYSWRPAQHSDAQAIHEMLLDIEAVDRRDWVDTLEERQRDFEDPASNPASDSWLAFTSDGKLAALAWVFAPPEGVTEYIAWLWGEVHPAHRRRGLGSYLMHWMEARGRQILASRPTDTPHYLRVSAFDTLHDRLALFEKHGFEAVRYFYRMRRDLSQPIPDANLPPGVILSHWSTELDASTLEAVNEAFQDHWGFIPVTEEVWRLWFTTHPNFRPDLTYLAVEEMGNGQKNVVALSINEVREEENRAAGVREGWVRELATRRAWRNKGIATALVCKSMQAFKAAGLDYAGLGVDTENLTGALRIYERLGFVPVRRGINFSKEVS